MMSSQEYCKVGHPFQFKPRQPIRDIQGRGPANRFNRSDKAIGSQAAMRNGTTAASANLSK